MKRGIKKSIEKNIEKQGYHIWSIVLAIIIILIALIIFSGYFLIFKVNPCDNKECFYKALENCNRVSWIKSDEQTTWAYVIKGESENKCNIEVRLVHIKQGTIELEKLQDKKMICRVLKSETGAPEVDMTNCNGELKEEIQDILIQRMHNYLLKNLGEIQEGFKKV